MAEGRQQGLDQPVRAVPATGRIRIVHCIDSFGAGGTELNLVRTLERLDPHRFEIVVAVLNDAGPLRERVLRTGASIRAFAFPRLTSLAAIRCGVRLIRWLRRFKPDVVHTHDRYTNLFVVPCARAAGVPLVISSRRWWTAMPRWIYAKGNRLAYRLSDRIIVNSAAAARLMVEHEGIPEARIVVLPNFVDEDAFASLDEDARLAARRSFGIPDGSLVVTAVAVFRPEKDLETLIEAVARLREPHPDLRLLLVGSGPCEAALRRRAVSAGVEDRVHFAGYLHSPPNPHAFGDLSVLCSLHEGFPNSIVEAMAAGKAVVATRVGGIPDAVEDGRTGLLVPPRAAERLAEAIGRLLRDPRTRGAFGEAGLAKARLNYEASAVIDRLCAVYREGLCVPHRRAVRP